jgi:serine/threonine protein kinase
MAEVLRKFGRYFLLDHTAQGGMAEIYRARLAATDQPSRIIVIKKIHAHLDADSEFKKMFRSETQISMGFNHPNIVQIYDFGEEQNQPYIVMEWVDGRNLRQILNNCAETDTLFPVEMSCLIIEQAAAGLHYAHNFKDKLTAEPLNIIHRDISPQNILVGYEGVVKLIDFGIAKASVNSEATKTGIIKGKPSYLAPEQIMGEILDARSDVFALGAVFWELLTGRKLFQGDSDLAVLKMIENVNNVAQPPSVFNAKVPKALDAIVLKALLKNKNDRYPAASDLQKAIKKFVQATHPEATIYELSSLMKQQFMEQMSQDHRLIQSLNQRAERMLQNLQDIPDAAVGQQSEEATKAIPVTPVEPSGDQPPQAQMTSPSLDIQGLSEKIPSFDLVSNVEIDPWSMQEKEAKRKDAKEPELGKAGTTKKNPTTHEIEKMVSQAPKVELRKNPFQSPVQFESPSRRSTRTIPVVRERTIVLPTGFLLILFLGLLAGIVLVPMIFPQNSPPWLIEVHKSLFKTFQFADTAADKLTDKLIDQTSKKALAPKSTSELPSAANLINLRLHVQPAGEGSTVTVNGTLLNRDQPVIQVELGALLEVDVQKNGFEHFSSQLEIQPSQAQGLKEWVMEVVLNPLNPSRLTLQTTPSADALLEHNGLTWIFKTPISDQKLPAGEYKVTLTNELLGLKKVMTLNLEPNKQLKIETKLNL